MICKCGEKYRSANYGTLHKTRGYKVNNIKKHKLYLIMGKSATGKDHIYKAVLAELAGVLRPVVPYTTRPMREGEQNGVEYFFIDEEKMKEFQMCGRIVEKRCYQTVNGPWNYMTVDDGQIDLDRQDSILIATPEVYRSLRDYYGSENTVPIYVESPDRERLARSLKREDKQEKPNYAEVCRRYLADEADFSDKVLEELGITKRYVNIDFNACVEEIVAGIKRTGNEGLE